MNMEPKHSIPENSYAGSIPVTHDMSLRKAPFRAVANGTKVIEMRLLDEKRRTIKVGDCIRFTLVSGTESVTAEVVGLHRFPSFEALYASLIPVVGAVDWGTPRKTRRSLPTCWITTLPRPWNGMGW